jgi:predicted DNA repair protein MutK
VKLSQIQMTSLHHQMMRAMAGLQRAMAGLQQWSLMAGLQRAVVAGLHHQMMQAVAGLQRGAVVVAGLHQQMKMIQTMTGQQRGVAGEQRGDWPAMLTQPR